MIYFIAIILGLIINYITGGIIFNSIVCIFAGLFLIMPFLLKLNINEIFHFNNKKILIKTLINNYIINMLIILIVSLLFFGFNNIIYGFILLGLLSGGGLLLSWISKSNGDTNIGFKLFIFHFLLFNILFLPFTYYIENYIEKNETSKIELISNKVQYFNIGNNISIQNTININNNEEKCIISDITGGKVSCFTESGKVSPIASIFILIIIPFLISRIIRINKFISNFIGDFIKILSQIFTFILITYIFSLESLNSLFLTPLDILLKIGISVLLIYLLINIYNFYILYKSNMTKEDISLFWLGTTRFLTLGLIFSFVYSFYLGNDIMLIFVLGYFFQIIMSIIMSNIINNIKK